MKYQNIAVVWKKKDKNGKTFLSFKAEKDIKNGESINLFLNDKGDNPSRPDFRAYNRIEDESLEQSVKQSLVEEPVEEVNPNDVPF